VTISTELFRLMPYLCQFIGTERDQDVAQACLQVLNHSTVVRIRIREKPYLFVVSERILTFSSYPDPNNCFYEWHFNFSFSNGRCILSPRNYILDLKLVEDRATVLKKYWKINGGSEHIWIRIGSRAGSGSEYMYLWKSGSRSELNRLRFTTTFSCVKLIDHKPIEACMVKKLLSNVLMLERDFSMRRFFPKFLTHLGWRLHTYIWLLLD